MPSLNGHAETNGTLPDTNGHTRPETPAGRMALTEYSVNPSPSSEEKRARIRQLVPEDLLLPNGFPDVSFQRPLRFLLFLSWDELLMGYGVCSICA